MANDNPWAVVSDAPVSPAGPAAPAVPALSNTGAGSVAGSAPDNPWTPVEDKPIAPHEDSIDRAFAGHPTLQKLNKGVTDGFMKGFGFTAPNPDDPNSLTLSDMASQTWQNLKKAATQSYDNWGGNSTGAVGGSPSDMVGNVARKAGAALMTIPDMTANGIESMASTVEDGTKELVGGIRSGDHEAAARGFGKVLASMGQVAVGMEGKTADTVIRKAGEGLENKSAIPGNSLLRATNPKNYLYGKNPGMAFIDEKITPTTSIENLQKQFEAAGTRLNTEVRDKLSQPNIASQRLDPTTVVEQTVQEALDDLTQQKGLRNRLGVIDAINKIKDDTLIEYDSQGYPKASAHNLMTPLEVSELKSKLGKSTKWDTMPGSVDPEIQSYVNDVRKRLYGRLNNMVEQVAPGTRDLNNRYANVIESSRLIAQRLAKEEGNELGLKRLLSKGEFWGGVTMLLSGLGLTESGVGGHAGVGGALAGAGMLADRAMRSTPGRIVRGRTMAAAGNAMQDAGASGTAGAVGNATAVAAEPHESWVKAQASDGKTYRFHPEDIEEAKKRDPGLKVIE